jgi:hypothetical protein
LPCQPINRLQHAFMGQDRHQPKGNLAGQL